MVKIRSILSRSSIRYLSEYRTVCEAMQEIKIDFCILLEFSKYVRTNAEYYALELGSIYYMAL